MAVDVAAQVAGRVVEMLTDIEVVEHAVEMAVESETFKEAINEAVQDALNHSDVRIVCEHQVAEPKMDNLVLALAAVGAASVVYHGYLGYEKAKNYMEERKHKNG